VSLITRCPACATAFRAQPGQLAAHGGQVRCGHCGEVFDGLAHLVGQQPGAAQAETATVDLDVGEPSPPAAPALQDAEARPAARATRRPADPFIGARKQHHSYSLLWGFLGLLTLIALAAQIALYFRVEIADRYPETRVYFAALCEELNCTLRLSHRPDLMSIESSDLQADPRREGLIQFNALLRNRAGFVQEYPSLEITLTDERDRPVLRRVLEPEDYLEARHAAELLTKGISPGGETSMRLHFDIGKLRATGYRLYLFYH